MELLQKKDYALKSEPTSIAAPLTIVTTITKGNKVNLNIDRKADNHVIKFIDRERILANTESETECAFKWKPDLNR